MLDSGPSNNSLYPTLLVSLRIITDLEYWTSSLNYILLINWGQF